MALKELEKDISLFCNVDEQGFFTNIIMGKYAMSVNQTDFFFKIDRRQERNIDKYFVNLQTRKLQQIEGTELELLPEDLVEPEESEEVKELKRRLAELEAKLKEQEETAKNGIEEPPVEEPAKDPVTDEPTEEPPVEEPTNLTE